MYIAAMKSRDDKPPRAFNSTLPAPSKPMNRGPGPKRSARLASEIAPSRKPVRNKKRTPSEFARIYGSKARVAWIKTRPCVGCRNMAQDGHHIAGDGVGRKAHHSLIVPVCRACHWHIHNHGARDYEARYRITLAVEAETTAREWLIESGRRGLTTP